MGRREPNTSSEESNRRRLRAREWTIGARSHTQKPEAQQDRTPRIARRILKAHIETGTCDESGFRSPMARCERLSGRTLLANDIALTDLPARPRGTPEGSANR